MTVRPIELTPLLFEDVVRLDYINNREADGLIIRPVLNAGHQ